MLEDAGIPHVNQSAYGKGIAYADTIFATQEVIARYLTYGRRVYMSSKHTYDHEHSLTLK